MNTDKKPAADALTLAADCETRAADLRESLPTIAQLFADAGNMLRSQYQALTAEKCKHMMTFTVTKELIAAGRETREPGKYCMTCGELIPKPVKPKKSEDETKTEDGGDGDDQDA